MLQTASIAIPTPHSTSLFPFAFVGIVSQLADSGACTFFFLTLRLTHSSLLQEEKQERKTTFLLNSLGSLSGLSHGDNKQSNKQLYSSGFLSALLIKEIRLFPFGHCPVFVSFKLLSICHGLFSNLVMHSLPGSCLNSPLQSQLNPNLPPLGIQQLAFGSMKCIPFSWLVSKF